MKFNTGMAVLVSIIFISAGLIAIAIQMPFEEKKSDDKNAYMGYRVDEEYIELNERTNKEETHVIVTVVNKGYAEGYTGQYDFAYKVFMPRPGEVGMYYYHSPTEIYKYKCDNGESKTFEIVFDTAEKGVLDTINIHYAYKEY